MRGTSLLGLVTELHLAIVHESRPADAVIAHFFRERRFLGARDRRFLADTVYGTVRHRRRCCTALDIAMQTPPAWRDAGPKPPSSDALLPAVYLALFADPDVDDAALAASFGAAGMTDESARTFLDALRGADVVAGIDDPVARLAITRSYPDWLVKDLVNELGYDETERLCDALNEQAPITLRANTLRGTVEACVTSLAASGVPTTQGKFSPTALLLDKRINAFSIPAFKEGLFEVQDEGSQMVSLFVDPHPSWKILDACAGAGGKTLHLAALMENRGEIFALVQHEHHDTEMRRRLRRANAQNVRVLRTSDTQALASLAGKMHVVLVDAPCSGTGTIRRNPMTKWRVTPDKVAQYAATQLDILTTYARAVRPGGSLVYVTCSLLRTENDAVTEGFLARHPEFTQAPRHSRYIEAGAVPVDPRGVLRLSPHLHGTDGFYAVSFTRAT